MPKFTVIAYSTIRHEYTIEAEDLDEAIRSIEYHPPIDADIEDFVPDSWYIDDDETEAMNKECYRE